MIEYLQNRETTFHWASSLRDVDDQSSYPAYLELKSGETKTRLSAYVVKKKPQDFTFIRPASVALNTKLLKVREENT